MRLLLKTIIPVLLLCLSYPSLLSAQTKRILVVHSYHPEYPWTGSITRGIKRTFFNDDVEIRVFHMDSKRKSLKRQKEAAGREALKIVEEFKPDAVIASDDNAQEFFVTHLAGREKPFVVFCGVNAELTKYNYPASNITGILERPHFSESIELLKKLVPDARRVAFLVDDSPTSHFAVDYILSFKDEYKDVDIVDVAFVGTFDEWKAKVSQLQGKADAICLYTYHAIKDEFGNAVNSTDIIQWTAIYNEIPLIGLLSFSVDDGALCGVVESAMEQGREAAAIARAVLFDGKKVDAFPPRVARGSQSMINLDAAIKFKIKVDDALKDTTDIVF